jgi:hypothetical protein
MQSLEGPGPTRAARSSQKYGRHLNFQFLTTFSKFELESDCNSKASNPKYSQITPSSCNAQTVTVCSEQGH